ARAPGSSGKGRAPVGGALRDSGPAPRREGAVTTMALAHTTITALVAALLVGGGLSTAVVAIILNVRRRQRTLAAILEDTMGTSPVPVEVVSESPRGTELSALTVRIAGIFGRVDTRGLLEQRLERASIP